MRIQGAVNKEQGQTFAIVVVKSRVVQCKSSANDVIRKYSPVFGGIPVVLMAQDSRNRATYFGYQDIVRFLSRMPLSSIPWREYTIN